MRQTSDIKGHKAVVFQEGDVVSGPFFNPQDLLFEEVDSYISDKTRLDKRPIEKGMTWQ